MKIAIVGCGFVADQYMSTLVHCRELELVAAYDQDAERTASFASFFGVRGSSSLDELLAEPGLELVLNLTNPRSHFEVTAACLRAGKHVYTEKPVAMDVDSAARLVELAESRGLRVACAPCNLLGRTAQTVWKAVKDGAIGEPLLAYATFDAGMIAPHEAPWTWKTQRGTPWPAKDEFEIGCTFEHAGYLLTCLLAMFGPVSAVTSFASCQVPDKGIKVDTMAPDFSVGCLEFADSRVVARVTCGDLAPRNKSLLLVGQEGTLSVTHFRDDTSPVHWVPHKRGRLTAKTEKAMEDVIRALDLAFPFLSLEPPDRFRFRRRYPYATKRPRHLVNRKKRVDFSLGPQEFAAAIREDRPCRLDARVGVHVVELINALQYPDPEHSRRLVSTRFDPIEPMPWS